MPRNASGVYSLPSGSTITNGDTSDATDLNSPLSDIVDDLNLPRPVSVGGTGSGTASGARANLGAQQADATLTSLAELGTASGKFAYTTDVDTWAEGDITAAGRALLDDADAAAQRTTLGLGNIATTNLIDEDDMASDTAAQAPTQQSVKAYVDASGPSTYTQAWTALTLGAATTAQAHGLSGAPDNVWLELKCVTTDGGFAVDDIVSMQTGGIAGSSFGVSVFQPSATEVQAAFGSSLRMMRAGGGTEFSVTAARWEYRLRAVKY